MAGGVHGDLDVITDVSSACSGLGDQLRAGVLYLAPALLRMALEIFQFDEIEKHYRWRVPGSSMVRDPATVKCGRNSGPSIHPSYS